MFYGVNDRGTRFFWGGVFFLGFLLGGSDLAACFVNRLSYYDGHLRSVVRVLAISMGGAVGVR